jgi:hypothetical protein
MSQTEAFAAVPRPEVEAATTGLPRLLIQVPHVQIPARMGRGPAYSRMTMPRPAPGTRRRRRLRKEFRIAAYSLSLLIPLVIAWSHRASLGMMTSPAPRPPAEFHRSLAASRISRGDASARVRFNAGARPPLPRVLLSIESVGPSLDQDAAVPVVLPGYLLPDDNHEDSSHEGS